MEQYLVPLETPCVYYHDAFLSAEEADAAYQDLYTSTAWETSPKINRWVCLCQDNTDTLTDTDNTDTNDTIAQPVKQNEEPLDGDVSNATSADDVATVATLTAKTLANDSSAHQLAPNNGTAYKYRDAPSASDGASATIIPFSPTLKRIQELIQDWYYQQTNIRVHFNVCLLNFYESGQQRIGWHADREEIGRTTPIASISLGATRQFHVRSIQNGVTDRATLHLQHGSLTIMENICQTNYVHSVPKEPSIQEGRINLTFRCKRLGDESTAGEALHERRDHWLTELAAKTMTLQSNHGTSTNIGGWSAQAPKDGAPNDKPLVFGDGVPTGQNVGKDNDDGSSSSTIQFLVSTNLGAECYCAAEILEVLDDLHQRQRQQPQEQPQMGPHSPPNECTTATSPINDSVSLTDTNGIADANVNPETTTTPLVTLPNRWTVMARPCGMDGYVAVIHQPSDDLVATNGHSQHKDGNSSMERLDEWTTSSVVGSQLLKLRSAHHVLQYHAHFDLKDCHDALVPKTSTGGDDKHDHVANGNGSDDQDNGQYHHIMVNGEMLYEYCKQRLVHGSLHISSLVNAQSFRVSCDRIGAQHGFRAPEVEREVGGAFSEFYNHCVPSMSDYDVHVRVDVIGSLVIIGTQLNVHDLSKERHFLKFRNAVTIKTNLAYAMVRCANIQPGYRIADPFCGSGTLLLEALDVFEKQIQCVGLDVSKRSVEGSRKNALAENYGPDVCSFVCSDARGLRRHLEDNSLDAMITNLPWGVMTGHKDATELQVLYEIFLRNSWYVLKDGARIVMLVLRGLQLMRIIRKLSGRYRLLSVNVVRTTNNLPCIVVVEKMGTDDVRESIIQQLTHLNKFVSVSPEIYNAIHNETVDES